ncbi:hypothetical protein F2Q69_00015105 [Brassica cretica]|uniref:Uncharacterized protein n=1 Tax=Brassica cretica TaxID=69181 RepID=A0A8S9QKS8_BRACR|nr:hypothetical protein F2Q69_00015105 [Brassica cretica]
MMKIRKEKRLLQRNQLQVKEGIEARMKLIQEARSDLAVSLLSIWHQCRQTRDHCLVRVVSVCVPPFMIDIK